jgi:enoyl-CoA hydratase
MTYRCFDFSISNKVAHLTFNRPDASNTMQPVFWRELNEIVSALQRMASARALVISSSGKHFTAGMADDVFDHDFPSVEADVGTAGGRVNMAMQLEEMQRAFTALERLRMPVIAAIQGGCIGSGVDMICACDIRLATKDAFFCIQEINVGMTADLGTLQRLPKLIPEGIVHELAYTGRSVSAQRALALGLVNEVFESREGMIVAALQMASEIAEKPPVAIWGSKQAIHYARDHSTEDALRQMGWLQAGIWQGANLKEALRAKQQGKSPQYADLPTLKSFADMNYDLESASLCKKDFG